MANIVVTSTGNSIKVDFGVYSSSIGILKAVYRKDKIIKFSLADGNDYIQAHVHNEVNWNLVYSVSGSNLIVDLVDGVAPVSNSDLYDKLATLIS